MVVLKSLSVQIAEALRAEIINGQIDPGERLSIDRLADRWGVSSTPVRDAVKSLETTGLVKVLPRRGVYVSVMDVSQLRHVYDLRIALESLGISYAISRIPATALAETEARYLAAENSYRSTGSLDRLMAHDHDVHDLILDYCDNLRLVELMDELGDLTLWARRKVPDRLASSYLDAYPEHLEILYALQARDMDLAQEAMCAHLENAYRRSAQGLTKS